MAEEFGMEEEEEQEGLEMTPQDLPSINALMLFQHQLYQSK